MQSLKKQIFMTNRTSQVLTLKGLTSKQKSTEKGVVSLSERKGQKSLFLCPKFWVLCCLMTFMSLATILNAQVTTASMSGKVSDAEGVPAPGAVLKATHTPTGTVYTTVTRNDGSYNINNMRIGGPYTVEVELLGSNKEAYDDVYLQLGQDLVLNPALSQDTKTLDVVTVTGTQDAVISASRTGAQEIFTSNEISKLPTINRSLSDFTQLTPMASKNGGFGGISYRFNNVTVDGASFSNSFGLSSQLGYDCPL